MWILFKINLGTLGFLKLDINFLLFFHRQRLIEEHGQHKRSRFSANDSVVGKFNIKNTEIIYALTDNFIFQSATKPILCHT